MAAFVDEVGKLAGLSSHPATLTAGPKKLLSGAPGLSGTTSTASQVARATSPASLVPPPNTFA